jgi:hypothetical protein
LHCRFDHAQTQPNLISGTENPFQPRESIVFASPWQKRLIQIAKDHPPTSARSKKQVHFWCAHQIGVTVSYFSESSANREFADDFKKIGDDSCLEPSPKKAKTIIKWALRDLNPRPSRCKRDALAN